MKKWKIIWVGLLAPIALFFISLFIGRYPVSISEVISSLISSPNVPPDVYNVIWGIRLPRAIAAFICGGALSVSGAVFQGVFRNPLASPDLIGISSGASFGAAISIILFNSSPLFTGLLAFVFGIATFLILTQFSSLSRIRGITGILLTGIILNAIFQSGITFLKYIADPLRQLPALEFWLMGSLNTASWEKIEMLLPICAVCISAIIMLRWQVNLLSLGDEEASALGVRVKTVRGLLVGASSVLVALTVSMFGLIAWIGLIAPHIVRILFGDNNKYAIPLSFSIGAVYLVAADTFSRSVSSAELPVSIATAFIGAPLLGYIIIKRGVRTWK